MEGEVHAWYPREGAPGGGEGGGEWRGKSTPTLLGGEPLGEKGKEGMELDQCSAGSRTGRTRRQAAIWRHVHLLPHMDRPFLTSY